MTKEELDFIKDAFSQIIDDIAGNPDWNEAARAVASDLGTLERELEEKAASLPSNLDEAAVSWCFENWGYVTSNEKTDKIVATIFKAGVEWMAGQGETKRGVATQDHFILFADDTYIDLDPTMKLIPAFKIKDAEEIVVQIRKKNDL